MNTLFRFRKTKNIYLKITLAVFIYCVMVFFDTNNYIYAQDTDTDIKTSQENLKVSDELYAMIQSTIENIKIELDKADEKIKRIRQTDSYEKYPAVRLNVDTPIFGIVDVVNNRLKITTDVSSEDIKKNYSINDIVKSKVIKLPSYTALSIVVITRDVNIDPSMTYSDANTIMFKLLQYEEQAKNTNDFIDSHVNSILSGYLDSEISSKYSKMKTKLDEINNENVKILESLNKLKLVQIENVAYYLDVEDDIYNKYSKLQKESQNLNISKEELAKLYDSIESLRVKTVNYGYFISEIAEKNTDFDMKKVLDYVKSSMNNEIEYISKYIEDSYTNANEVNSDNIDKAKEANIDTTEKKVLYNTTSKNILENMKKSLDAINIYIEQLENNPQVNSQAGEIEQVETTGMLDYNYIISEVQKIYMDFLNKENAYIKDNINLLLVESKTKVNTIGKYTLENIFEYIKNVYSIIPQEIEQNSININSKSVESIYDKNAQLKETSKKLVEYNIDINEIYNNLIDNEENMNRNSAQ